MHDGSVVLGGSPSSRQTTQLHVVVLSVLCSPVFYGSWITAYQNFCSNFVLLEVFAPSSGSVVSSGPIVDESLAQGGADYVELK